MTDFEREMREKWKQRPIMERIKSRVSDVFSDIEWALLEFGMWLFDSKDGQRIPAATIILYLVLAGVLTALVIVNVLKRLC